MSWQRTIGRGLEAVASLVCLGLLLAPSAAPESAAPPRTLHAGTRIAVLGAGEVDFGLWRGADLGEGGALAPRSRIAVAFRPSGEDQVQLFARSDLELPREIPLATFEGGRRLQAPAPGRTLVYSGGSGALLLRVCPPGERPLDLSTAAGLREVQDRFREPAPAGAGPRPLVPGPGWLARLPDGAPVELPWRWLSGRGCVHRVVRLSEEHELEGSELEAQRPLQRTRAL